MRWSRHSHPSLPHCRCCDPRTVPFPSARQREVPGPPGPDLRSSSSSRKRPANWLWPWTTLLVMVAVLAPRTRLCAAAPQAGPQRVCGTPFTDPESSALLADVVLEGRVREKNTPVQVALVGEVEEGAGRRLLLAYNITLQVRKHVWKGEALIRHGGKRASKLVVGPFAARPSDPNPPSAVSNVGDDGLKVAAARDGTSNSLVPSSNSSNSIGKRKTGGGRGRGQQGSSGGGGADGGKAVGTTEDPAGGGQPSERAVSEVTCLGDDVDDGATYIFFLKEARDGHGRYLLLAAPPVRRSKRVVRLVGKIIKEAKAPQMQPLSAPKKISKGENLSLRCKAKAKPDPVFSWLLNGQQIASNRTFRIKSNKRGSRLQVNNLQSHHSGVFTCQASNAVGTATQEVKVELTELKQLHKACEKQTYCFNGGSCRYVPALGIAYCHCPENYAGVRCEKEVVQKSIYPGEARLLYDRTLIIVGLVIALLVFVVVCIASFFLAKRRQKKSMAKRRLDKARAAEGMAGTGDTLPLLLDVTDGHASHAPGGSTHVDKSTQTTEELTSSQFQPPACTNASHTLDDVAASNPTPQDSIQPSNCENIFRQLQTFSAPAPDRRSSSLQQSSPVVSDLERRGSRSRLKAVSVEDSCQDRPQSVGRAEVPDRATPPIIVEVPETELAAKPAPADEGNNIPQAVAISGPVGAGRTEKEDIIPEASPRRPNMPDFRLLDEPVPMGTPPRDNAHAQLKTPSDSSDGEEQAPPFEPKVTSTKPTTDGASSDSPVTSQERWPYSPDFPNGVLTARPPQTAVFNGQRKPPNTDEAEEAIDSPLPSLYINEENLDGNMSKRDSFQSRFPALIAPSFQPPQVRDSSEADRPGVADSIVSAPSRQLPQPLPSRRAVLAEGAEGGDWPRLQTDAVSNGSPAPYPRYAYDPTVAESPDLDQEFMHGSPLKPGGQRGQQMGGSGRLNNVGHAEGQPAIDRGMYNV